MSDLERNGSFQHEPSVSEEAIALKLDELTRVIRPDAKSHIERRFSIEQSTPFENRELYRSKQALAAALRHEIGDDMAVTFKLNETWDTADPYEVTVSLTGTEAVKGRLRYNEESGRFNGFLQDENGDILPRDSVDSDVVTSALASFGVYPSLNFSSQQGLAEWLQPQSTHETHQHVLQRHVLYQSTEDEALSGTCELEKEQLFTPDEVSSYVRFIETTLIDENEYARIVELSQSENGATISVSELTHNNQTDETQRTRRQLDYELIEKIIRHIDIAELHATR